MTNPFTRSINRADPDSELGRFVDAWDELEGLLIEVFRSGRAGPEDEKDWAEIRDRLLEIYPAVLQLFASESGAASIPAVLALKTAREMIGNRAVLRLLPDVREAINRVLLERGEGGG